jgi:hypothetical protein
MAYTGTLTTRLGVHHAVGGDNDTMANQNAMIDEIDAGAATRAHDHGTDTAVKRLRSGIATARPAQIDSIAGDVFGATDTGRLSWNSGSSWLDLALLSEAPIVQASAPSNPVQWKTLWYNTNYSPPRICFYDGTKWRIIGGSMPEVAVVFQAGNTQSITDNNDTSVLFDTGSSELSDTDGLHSPTVNPARITIPTAAGGGISLAGMWVFETQVAWALDTAGWRQASLNFVTAAAFSVIDTRQPPSGGASVPGTYQALSHSARLNEGDYVTLSAKQSSSSPHPINLVWATSINARYVGP